MKTEQLSLVVDEARAISETLKNNYPKLSVYPVFSLSAGQCNLTIDLKEILRKFPDMVHDSEDKNKAITLLHFVSEIEAKLKQADGKGNVVNSLTSKLQAQMSEINQIADQLEFREDIFIELRFEKQILEEIFKLQSDPFVSQRYTPQTTASVRIVLGTIDELYKSSLLREKTCEV